MHKITVYLPEELKRSLHRMAAESGRSEAELIREAVTTQVSAFRKPRPRGGLFASGDLLLSEHVDEALAGFGDR